MATSTIPLAMPDELLAEIRDTAIDTHLPQAAVMKQSIRLGLPLLRRSLTHKKLAALQGKTLADVITARPLDVSFNTLNDAPSQTRL